MPAVAEQLAQLQQAVEAALQVLRPVRHGDDDDELVAPVFALLRDELFQLAEGGLVASQQKLAGLTRPQGLFDFGDGGRLAAIDSFISHPRAIFPTGNRGRHPCRS